MRLTLPPGLQREYDLAVERTGETPALKLGGERIAYLLAQPPWQVELAFSMFEDLESQKELDKRHTVR